MKCSDWAYLMGNKNYSTKKNDLSSLVVYLLHFNRFQVVKKRALEHNGGDN